MRTAKSASGIPFRFIPEEIVLTEKRAALANSLRLIPRYSHSLSTFCQNPILQIYHSCDFMKPGITHLHFLEIWSTLHLSQLQYHKTSLVASAIRGGASVSFWVYENWRADDKTMVHRAQCSRCNQGNGTGKGTLGNINGEWHGPFKTCDEAKRYALSRGRKKSTCCSFCKPEHAWGLTS